MQTTFQQQINYIVFPYKTICIEQKIQRKIKDVPHVYID